MRTNSKNLFDAKIFPVDRDNHCASGQHQTDLKSRVDDIPFWDRGNYDNRAHEAGDKDES